MIGHRLKLARDAAGLSLRDLQERINSLVTAQAIGKYERDEMMPSSTVLLALAKALNVSPEYLLSKKALSLSEIDFRKGPAAGAKEERAVEAIVMDYAERYLNLEELLPDAARTWKAPVGKEFEIASIEDAELAAGKLREQWDLGVGPINSMMELLGDKGIKVVSIPLPDAISGSKAFARQKDKNAAALIVVNEKHNVERQRFSLAHELGHLVLRFNADFSDKMQESAADRFAGAFLIVKEVLYKLVGKSRHVVPLGELISVKRFFKVSIACLVVRCRQLGIITQVAYGRIWATFKANGWIDVGSAEPSPIPKETEIANRMQRLCLRAVGEGAISESKAAELLRVSRRELEHLLEFQPV
ncbi:MAG TPA: XRE family transcriptional regulator [Burkholderiales bacterium]|nr:XRE family transcriptional regulator [Burkholderiales bacterium]